MSANLDAALSYAARGWRVHRLYHLIRNREGVVTGCACNGVSGSTGPDGEWISTPNGCAAPTSGQWGKHPCGKWRQTTTTDPDAIRAAWSKHPRAQVGIACGPESDLWVLDVDGTGGRAQLAALEAQHGALPVTWTVTTGSGGEQRYFRWPLDGRKPANRAKMVKVGAPTVGEGLDARGDGGQVVAPPSENRNGRYRVTVEAPLAYAPGWLLDLVCPPVPVRQPPPPPASGVTGEGIEKRLRGCLAYLCREVATAPEGGRNAALNKATWTIGRHIAYHGILSRDEVEEALLNAARAAGLDTGGAVATIRSTLATAQGSPLPLADRERPESAPKRPRSQGAQRGPQEARHAAPEPEAAQDTPPPEEAPQGAAQAAGEASPPPPADPPPPAPGIEGLPPGWVTPPGWILDGSGVYEIRGEGRRERAIRITNAPIWISARWRDVDTGDASVRLAWPGGSAVLCRGTAMSRNELAALSRKNAPVTSQSAPDVVRWLDAAESANAATIPQMDQVGRLGWTVTAEGAPALQHATGPHTLRLPEGMAQMQAAIQPHGRWESWLDAARHVLAVSPVAALLLAASVGSVILPRLDAGAAPFILDLHGLSTTGKTTALRFAASGWGAPQDGAGLLIGWDTSPTAIEGRAGALRHWPLFMDDTKKVRARDREALAGLVYNWSAGQGRGRGTIDGSARTVATWRAIMISTGEQRLAGVCGGHHAGAMMRMLPVSAAPFPAECDAVGLIEGLDAWGHLPARVGARIVEVGDDALRARWIEDRAMLAGKLGGGSRAVRLGGMGATILAGVDVLRGVGVEIDPDLEARIMRLILDGLLATGNGADMVAESWSRICAWVASSSDRLSDRPGEELRHSPPGGWIGRMVSESRAALSPALVERELGVMGFEPGEVVAQWEKRGWLIPDKRGKRAQVVRWRGIPTRMWVVDLGAGLGLPDDEDDAEAEAEAAH